MKWLWVAVLSAVCVVVLALIFFLSASGEEKGESKPINVTDIPHTLIIPENWNGKCILFMHGLGGSKEKWKKDMDFFSSHGYCCLAFDLPYHGERGKGLPSFDKFPEIIINGSNEVVMFSYYLKEKIGAKEVYAIGKSLGSQVLGVALGKEPPIEKAVLLLASANLTYTFEHSSIAENEEARKQVESWLYSDIVKQMDPIYFLPKYKGAVQLHCGLKDEVLPPESCEFAYKALNTQKKLIWHDQGHYMRLEDYGWQALQFFEGQSFEDSDIYVTIVMHSEDPHHKAYPDFRVNESAYLLYRERLVNFTHMLLRHNLTFDFQPDWNFLEGARLWEKDELKKSTNGKNVIEYLYDLGVEIDPHSHENEGYNYADVAYLISLLNATPSKVVGGHIYIPNSTFYQNWPRFVNEITGSKYPEARWKADILWGESTPKHEDDPVVSGVWKPKDEWHFFEHSDEGQLIAVGGYERTIAGVEELIEKYEKGELERGKIYTATVFVGHSQCTRPEFIEGFEKTVISKLEQWVKEGKIHVVTLEEVVEIWKQKYNETPNILIKYLPQSY